MVNFTSSLYLGFEHPARSLRPWPRLTLGAPPALRELPETREVATQLAALQGCEASILAKSTLHLFWDLFGLLSRNPVAIFLDDGAYPTAHWGVERAAGRGVPVHRFPHHDSTALAAQLRKAGGRRCIVVADGVCSCCGCAAPLAAYQELLARCGGLLVLDDTQALGLLGRQRGPAAPYGSGGGGALRWAGIDGRHVLMISSLAKAFGAPIAALSGMNEIVEHFAQQSETRMHCSPPSAVDIGAARSALHQNAAHGDALRLQLAQRVRYFRTQLDEAGISASGGMFPVQTIELPPTLDPYSVHGQLLRHGVRAILRRGRQRPQARLSLILTARHRDDEIDRAVEALSQIMRAEQAPQLERG